MNEHFLAAVEELKRVDHLIYVSLKYTRTTDVLKNVIQRMITTCECLINSLGKIALEQGKVRTLPPAPVIKAKELKRIFAEHESILSFLELYTLLRTLNKAEYNSINEYRRHVTLIAQLDEGEYHVHIDKVTEFYKNLKGSLDYIKHIQ